MEEERFVYDLTTEVPLPLPDRKALVRIHFKGKQHPSVGSGFVTIAIIYLPHDHNIWTDEFTSERRACLIPEICFENRVTIFEKPLTPNWGYIGTKIGIEGFKQHWKIFTAECRSSSVDLAAEKAFAEVDKLVQAIKTRNAQKM